MIAIRAKCGIRYKKKTRHPPKMIVANFKNMITGEVEVHRFGDKKTFNLWCASIRWLKLIDYKVPNRLKKFENGYLVNHHG